jgi:peptide/nickel transport system substrate-binding protein
MQKRNPFLTALALVLTVSLMALAGCSNSSGPTGSGSDPAKGGSLNIGFTYEPVTLDPHVTGQAIAFRILLNIVDPYVWVTTDGKVHPGLATSWEISPDGKVYTLKLRSGVKFQDGTPFDANAAKFSFDRIMDPATASQSAISYLGPYDHAEVVDANTIKVVLKEPFAPFLKNLGSASLAPVSPDAVKKEGKDFGRKPIGTGPFMVKEWLDKDHLTLTRNPDYNWAPDLFKHTGPANLDELVFKFVSENQVRYSTLTTGELQLIEGVPSDFVADLKKQSDKFTVYSQPYPGSPRHAMINTQRFPTDDVAVRQAILYAYNSDAVLKTLAQDVYPPGNGPMSAATWGATDEYRQTYKFDPAKAKALLDKAGWVPGPDGIRTKGGKKLQLVANVLAGVEDYEAFAQALQANLRDVGMDMKINAMSRSPWYASNANGEHNLTLMALYNTDPDMLRSLWHSKGGVFTWSKYNNPAFDTLVDKGRAEQDDNKRLEIYKQAQSLLVKDAVALPLYDQMNIMASSAKVKGIVFEANAYPMYYDVTLAK